MHIDTIHRKLNPFTCTFCNKSFTTNGHLTVHVNAVHKKLKPFSCTLSDKSFGQKSNLNKHVAQYHQGKPLSLKDYCYESTKTENSQNTWENQLKQLGSDSPFRIKAELNEPASDSLLETKLEFPSEQENKGFCETSKQNTVNKTLKISTCTLYKDILTQHIKKIHAKLEPPSQSDINGDSNGAGLN